MTPRMIGVSALIRRGPLPITCSTGNSTPRWKSSSTRPIDASSESSPGSSIRTGPGVLGPRRMPASMKAGIVGSPNRSPNRATSPAINTNEPKARRSACSTKTPLSFSGPGRDPVRRLALEKGFAENGAQLARPFFGQLDDDGGIRGRRGEDVELTPPISVHDYRNTAVGPAQIDVVPLADPRQLLHPYSMSHSSSSRERREVIATLPGFVALIRWRPDHRRIVWSSYSAST